MKQKFIGPTLALFALAGSPFALAATDPAATQNKNNPPPSQAPVDDGDHHQTAKGVVGGAVLGHMAGHHAVKGAIVGGAIGAMKKHHDKKKAREQAAKANSSGN